MKQAILLVAIAGLVSCKGSSQAVNENLVINPSYEKAMMDNLKMLDTARTPVTLLVLANNFERIGNAEKTYWEPFYYAALAYSYMAHGMPDKAKTDPYLVKAGNFLQKASELTGKNSEVTTLQAMITNLQILIDPIARFQEYSVRSNELLAQAKDQDPTNPRPYLVEARFLIYTPAGMGGGPEATKPVIEKAITLYKTFQPKNSLAPNWGRSQAEQVLDRINSK